MLAQLLRMLGNHEVVTAHDGPTALAEMARSQPEIVLLDIGLPGMDGIQVGQLIRELPEFDGVLLVAVTGYGRDEDRRKTQQVGFDEHLVKPPSIEQLKMILAHSKLR